MEPNWPQRLADCQRRARTVYPELVRARKVYQRLDRVYTYWSNRAFEAERQVKKQEGKITFVVADKTRRDIDRAKAVFRKAFLAAPAEQQEQMLRELTK